MEKKKDKFEENTITKNKKKLKLKKIKKKNNTE